MTLAESSRHELPITVPLGRRAMLFRCISPCITRLTGRSSESEQLRLLRCPFAVRQVDIDQYVWLNVGERPP